ncbi:uncharacterized protein LOC123473911 [Daphnia magna]|uniref:uncharacterized protein LOC123473911 n=1 Tax=Daphnia magna TaxID=35525 RepID=UPI001E1BACD3|nr:uncharacterized protein LOC123473911 [Daphnia magna]
MVLHPLQDFVPNLRWHPVLQLTRHLPHRLVLHLVQHLTSDPNVDVEKCELCGDRVDYFLILDHIESCSSSSRPILPPSTSVSQALMDLNQPDDIESIQECELSPEPCVENDGCSLTLDHGGCIETTVASCSSMLSTGHELDDAKPSTSDTSLLGHIYETLDIFVFITEAAMQKFEGFISKIKMTNGSNVLKLSRPYYVKAAVNASQATQFMASLLSKFVVVFKGEEGVDVGGVRRDFFSHLFHRFENLLIDNRVYMKGEGDTLSETEYAAGIFFGISMVQEKIYHPAVIELLKSGGLKFVEGLNVFDNLGEFLNRDTSLLILFKRHPLTADGMIALLRRDANLDPNCEIIEKMNFLFICKFFKEISKGLISINTAGENKPMCLEDVLQFLTGKRIIAPGDDSVIQVEFIKSTEDGFHRPAVSTCAQKVTATLAEEYEVMRDVWIEAVAQLIIGFTLN